MVGSIGGSNPGGLGNDTKGKNNVAPVLAQTRTSKDPYGQASPEGLSWGPGLKVFRPLGPLMWRIVNSDWHVCARPGTYAPIYLCFLPYLIL